MDEKQVKDTYPKTYAEAQKIYGAGLRRALELIGENRPEIDEDGMGGAALNYEALGYNQALAELRTRIQAEMEGDNGR